jgi:hypothetical protein
MGFSFAINNNSAVCSTDWEMRLVNGGSSLEGRLEVCLNGVWGTICDQSWDDRDAGVACSQIGYSARGTSLLQINQNSGFSPLHVQVQLLVAQLTLMKDSDLFSLLAFNAMEQKLDYGTVLTQHKILALIQLMLVLHVLVSTSSVLASKIMILQIATHSLSTW